MRHDPSDGRLLVAEVLGGNRAAFETLIGQYQRLVSHVVFRMVADRSDREDICQEVFIKVYENLAGFHFDCKLSTWIARIAYNSCLHHVEKKRLPLVDDLVGNDERAIEWRSNVITPDVYAEQTDIASLVRVEIEALPVHYRAMLTMYHLDEMSYEEISEVTGMPLGTVKSYLFRARKLLKERLTVKYQPEDILR
ncbi:MAG TPA: sigma-70 family RNA polymerase sigma factor [Candidatus Deferrimicrobium sp.]|nr:sigma-70 family RNA polymerase sigma factor [Candidatus Deferrimicrobium sp.]